jgi:hypothetical protein
MDIIHTDAPLMPLTQMVGAAGHVQVSTDATGTKRDCFYGWIEPMADAVRCKPHHLVVVHDDTLVMAVAEAIAATGHQVVVTDFGTWSENQRVLSYDDDHSH